MFFRRRKNLKLFLHLCTLEDLTSICLIPHPSLLKHQYLSHDINILYYFETEDIDSVEKCAKTFMKKYQYRKYKEVYQVNIDIIKEVISSCGKIPENIKLKENKDNKYFMHISNEKV